MTDQPGAEAPAIAETNVLTPEADAPEVTATEESVAESAPAKEDEPQDKIQARFDKLTREKYDALRSADTERYQRERLEERLRSLETAKTEPDAPAGYPTLAESGYDEVAHAAAIAKFVKGLSAAEVKAAFQQEREATSKAEREKTFQKRQADFAATTPDYAEKVIEGGKRLAWTCTDEMAQVIRESDVGPQVAYYLATNPDKASEISQLSALAQAREIGRIEARLEVQKAAPVPSVSKAPPPTPSIKGETPAFTIKADSPESDSLSDEEWKRRREKQVQKQRS